jgi:carbamoyl-phosphate synthase large subunit
MIKVLVTGVGGGGVGRQIVKALRLAKTPYYIVGVDAVRSSLFDVDFAANVPRATDPTYVDSLLSVCIENYVDVVIPGTEVELKVLSDNRSRYEDAGVLLLVNSKGVIDIGLNKWGTMEFLKECGFKVPWGVPLRNADDFPSAIEAVQKKGYPVIIKPCTASGGSSNVFIAQSDDDLHYLCKHLIMLGVGGVVQEYFGTKATEYTIGVLSSPSGNILGSIGLKRDLSSGLSVRYKVPNRTDRIDLGEELIVSSGVSQGVIGPFKEVCTICEEMAESLNSLGPLNIQCRVHDGEVIPFEVNPRFSGTCSIRAMAGFNEPDALIRLHFFGENPTLDTVAMTVARDVSEHEVV